MDRVSIYIRKEHNPGMRRTMTRIRSVLRLRASRAENGALVAQRCSRYAASDYFAAILGAPTNKRKVRRAPLR
jgi:hypothetical protein